LNLNFEIEFWVADLEVPHPLKKGVYHPSTLTGDTQLPSAIGVATILKGNVPYPNYSSPSSQLKDLTITCSGSLK